MTLYDLQGGTIANLDAKKKRAELHDLAARNAKLEKEYPRAQADGQPDAVGHDRHHRVRVLRDVWLPRPRADQQRR